MALLEINDQDSPSTRVEIGDHAVIGRLRECTVQLREPHASRRHAELFKRGDDWYIMDLDTRNGTLVNGKTISESRLTSGDVITIGKATIIFHEKPPQEVHAGEVIGGYDVVDEISRSSYSRMCRVTKPGSSRQMIMKIFDRAAFGARIENVMGTARALALVNHPAVATIYEVNPQGDHPYCVSEYVQGRTLAEMIATEIRIPPDRAKSIAIHVADGLLVAHSRGIIHGNLKPRNVMVGLAGEIKLVDFGGTCRAPGQAFPSIPYYVAPEQILDRPVDLRTDIYSLGAILYCMLSGAPMFTGRSDEEIVQKHLAEPPQDLALLVPGLPVELCRIVERMVAKEPAARFQSTQELINVLRVRTQPAAPIPVMPAYEAAPKAPAREAPADRSISPVTAFLAGIVFILLLLTTFIGARELGHMVRERFNPPQDSSEE